MRPTREAAFHCQYAKAPPLVPHTEMIGIPN